MSANGSVRTFCAPCIVELCEAVLKNLLFLVLLHKSVASSQAIELIDHPFEQLAMQLAAVMHKMVRLPTEAMLV